MEFKVIKRFLDKNTREKYEVGTVYESDDKNRLSELKRGGFLEDKKEETALDKNVNEVISSITADLGEEKLKEILVQEIDGKDRKTVKEHIEALLKGDQGESGKTE